MNGLTPIEHSTLREVAGKYSPQEWMRSLNRRAGDNPLRLKLAAEYLGEILRLRRSAFSEPARTGKEQG